ncbi:MAG: TIGR00725 family protein [Desulfuromonas sp.]|nr:MAG: TIGR00725 family protein [Desulfuromonas sp.]
MPQTLIAVIGAGRCDTATAELAFDVGAEIARQGATLLCGGLGGVMEAAAKGCQEAGGVSLGLLPGSDAATGNPYLTYALPTNLGHARNVVIAQSATALVAVEGEYGTLSEIAAALKIGRPVVVLGRWSHLEGVMTADSPAEAVRLACFHCTSSQGVTL